MLSNRCKGRVRRQQLAFRTCLITIAPSLRSKSKKQPDYITNLSSARKSRGAADNPSKRNNILPRKRSKIRKISITRLNSVTRIKVRNLRRNLPLN